MGDTEANRHKYAATSFGVGADYLQSKILADNNIKPPSIERRIELDKRWEKLQVEIRKAYYKQSSSQSPPSAMEADEFCDNESTRELFGAAIEELNRGAKRVNDAIIATRFDLTADPLLGTPGRSITANGSQKH